MARKRLLSRRHFLKNSAVSAAVAVGFPAIVPSSAFGSESSVAPSNRIVLGFIGVGKQGRQSHVASFRGNREVQIVAVSDAFMPRCHQAVGLVPNGEKCGKYHDYRQMFDKEKLDAVFVETTCHARVLICIHAMQAGLDVYGEKPLTLTVGEGRTLVKAVRKYNRILQTGTQQRSMPINMHASKLVRDGAIGKVHTVLACNFAGPRRWAGKPAQPVPDGLDWDQWCNQTELRPYHRDLQFGWANWRAYDGGGQSWGVTGWGTHAYDQVQCGLGTDDSGPLEIWPEGQGANCKVTMRYANGTLLKLHGARRGMEDLGAIFVGDKGKIEIKRGRYMSNPKELLEGAPEQTPQGPRESVPHIKNFFDCIRSRGKPNADAETGHRATTICHLVNICRELGRKLRWDPKAEKFTGDDEADKLLSRPRRKGYELPEIG